MGKANVIRDGTDLSIIAHGKSVHTSLQVAQTLEEKHKVSAEVVDLRSIRPLDTETILASVRKTNRVLLVEENKPFCGVDAQIAFLIKIKLSITLTLQSRGFPPLTPPSLQQGAERSRYQIMIESLQSYGAYIIFIMATIIDMPKLSDTMSVGTVVKSTSKLGTRFQKEHWPKSKRTRPRWSLKISRTVCSSRFLSKKA